MTTDSTAVEKGFCARATKTTNKKLGIAICIILFILLIVLIVIYVSIDDTVLVEADGTVAD